MSSIQKLLERFLSVPSDFTWDELKKILSYYGFEELKPGGSRRKFVDSNNNLILLPKPHPGKIVKKYAMRQIIDNLKEKGKIIK